MMKPICKLLLLCLPVLLTLGLRAQESLSLERALAIAMNQNFDIRIARQEQMLSRQANTPGAAGFLPVISAAASQQNNINNSRQEFFSGDIRQGDNVKSENLGASVQLNWIIFDGLNMFVTKEKLNELEAMGELQARIRIENVVYRLITLYYTLALEQKKLKVIRQAVDISQERRHIAEQRFALGSGSGLELLQARVDLNSDSSALLQQEYALLNAGIMFNEILAVSPQTRYFVSDSFPLREMPGFEELLSKMLLENPELRLARSQYAVEMLEVKQQRSGYMPRISVGSGYNFSQSESEIGIIRSGQNRGISYGITAGWTLFDGFNQQQQMKMARIFLEKSVLEREQAEMQLHNELFRLYFWYQTRLLMIDNERQNLMVARQNLAAATEKMRLGSITAIELREAQKNALDAEYRLIMAQFEAKQGESRLLMLSGNLL